MLTIETRFRQKLDKRLDEMIEAKRDELEQDQFKSEAAHKAAVGYLRALRALQAVLGDVEDEMLKEG